MAIEDTTEHSHEHRIKFFIDREEFHARTPRVTVRELLVEYAKEDPAQTTLVERRGDELIPLTNLDETLTLRQDEHFFVRNNKPTPVS